MFLNYSFALCIYWILPATVAEEYKLFFKLKIVQSDLRSIITQEILPNVNLISVHDALSFDKDINDTINEIAIRKSRKVNFGCWEIEITMFSINIVKDLYCNNIILMLADCKK